MEPQELMELQWPYLLGCLPEQDLEGSAREWGAIVRLREVDSASTLLRLALAYGFCQMSLRQTAAWAEAAGIARISDVALLKRLQKAGPWLGHLLADKLAESAPLPALGCGARSIRLVDATTINQPGCKGTDFRLHLGYDLVHQSFNHLELTDNKGGESLLRYHFTPGELVIADRGYSHRKGMNSVVQSGAAFLVRVNWMNIPLQTRDGAPFEPLSVLRGLPEAQPCSIPLQVAASLKDGLPAIPVQLIAVRRSEAAAAAARRETLSSHNQQRSKLQPRTLELAGYVCLLTNLDPAELSAADALELYRFRWQIEIAFKRLKGLLALGVLPAKNPDLAHTMVYAKLIAALLLDDFTGRYLAFFPWGYRLGQTPTFNLAGETVPA